MLSLDGKSIQANLLLYLKKNDVKVRKKLRHRFATIAVLMAHIERKGNTKGMGAPRRLNRIV